MQEREIKRPLTLRDGGDWFDPASLGDGIRLFVQDETIGALRVYVNQRGDEGFSIYLGI